MPTAEQARAALVVLTSKAVADASALVTVNADATRDALMAATPEIVSYYSDGTAALAADHYDDLRDASGARRLYVAEPVVSVREEAIRTGVLWSVGPLYSTEPDEALALSRIGEIVQYETARPFRDTILTNSRRDPESTGWQRVTSGGCKFCRMLADRGAVYREASAHFASHPHCHCSAAPVFNGDSGEEASVMQYMASRRTRTPSQRQALREFLAAMP